MEEKAISGYDRVAEALGMDAPKAKLRVVRPDERSDARETTNGVWRPSNLGEYVGQERARIKVKMHVTAAINNHRQPGHMMISGPPGLGKTSLAAIVAAMMNEERPAGEHVAFHEVMGTTVKTEKQLAKALAKLREGDILFIDECHQMSLKSEEMLGLAMEDGKITVAGTESGTTDGQEVEIPPFTLVGATTKPANLSKPLRDRMKLTVRMEWYPIEDLATIVLNAAKRDELAVTEGAALAIAQVGRNTPRITLGILEQVGAYASTLQLPTIDSAAVQGAFDVIGIDELGLDERDREYMEVLASWCGRRAGLDPVAAKFGLDKREIADDIEPYLLRAGLLDMSSRGRCLTRAAYQHLWPAEPIPPLLGLS